MLGRRKVPFNMFDMLLCWSERHPVLPGMAWSKQQAFLTLL